MSASTFLERWNHVAINPLIHRDYGQHTRKPVIRMFAHRAVFWSPGDAFATADQVLEPTEKEVRNSTIVNAFHRADLSDQAVTSIHSIVGNWRRLGHFPQFVDPDLVNDQPGGPEPNLVTPLLTNLTVRQRNLITAEPDLCSGQVWSVRDNMFTGHVHSGRG